MMGNLERLVYMANQIARNFEAIGAEAAATATADHMIAYWDPRMKDQIVGQERAYPNTLTPIARAAVRLLDACSTVSSAKASGVSAADAG